MCIEAWADNSKGIKERGVTAKVCCTLVLMGAVVGHSGHSPLSWVEVIFLYAACPIILIYFLFFKEFQMIVGISVFLVVAGLLTWYVDSHRA